MKRKNKNVWIITAVFGSIAIASTGFAAWIITGDHSTEATGNVVVETAEDQRLTLSAEFLTNEGKTFEEANLTTAEEKAPFQRFVLGDVSEVSGSKGHWLDSNSTDLEDLTVKLKVSCTNYDASKSKITWYIDTTAAIGDYITLPNSSSAPTEITSDKWTKVGETNVYTATIDVTITWGSAFNTNGENRNPADYFSYFDPSKDDLVGESGQKDNGAFAVKTMNDMHTAFANKTFTVHINADADGNVPPAQ